MNWLSTKTYAHSEGLSCAFRQWRAESHCRLLHGYALQFKFKFIATHLDHNNWAVDFGALAELKDWLHIQFDHTLAVANDDPELPSFQELERLGLASLRIFESVGCEKFAEYAFKFAQSLVERKYNGRVRVASVEVREHDSNSAIYSEA